MAYHRTVSWPNAWRAHPQQTRPAGLVHSQVTPTCEAQEMAALGQVLLHIPAWEAEEALLGFSLKRQEAQNDRSNYRTLVNCKTIITMLMS